MNELKLSRASLKYLEVIFKVKFSLALPSWLLKLPFQFTTAGRAKEMRAAEKLSLELRANFNVDKLTSRICSQAPKRYPKWWRPMTNCLLLWEGISLGSDVLWELKQRSVTQLSVVFL